jgi:hypothetical protein
MVIDFVGVLIESTKCVDKIVANVGDRGINQARWSLAHGGDDFREVWFGSAATTVLGGRAGGDVGVIRGS